MISRRRCLCNLGILAAGFFLPGTVVAADVFEGKTMKNDLYDLCRRRRSIRRYGGGHIDDAIIKEIMKVALTAPSSFGHRPVEFVVVRDKALIRQMGNDDYAAVIQSFHNEPHYKSRTCRCRQFQDIWNGLRSSCSRQRCF